MKKIPQKDWHNSMRGYFGACLYNAMIDDPDIIVITMDLGYILFDKIRDDFPDRFYNVGAAESAGMDIAVGLAYSGKKPWIYSITTFLLYRAFETIRTYINHEQLNVKLIGSGRDKDYAHDGISHWSEDAWKLFDNADTAIFNNIQPYWPDRKEQIPAIVSAMIKEKKPMFLSLRR